MLTQQIARNACFVMAGIEPERFAAKTDSAIRQFDTSLNGLRHGDTNLGLFPETNPEVLENLDRVEVLWKTLGAASRQIAAGDVHPVPMQQLIALNIETKDVMNEAVTAIRNVHQSDASPEELSQTINVAGRQRMLSQKAAKEVCFLVLDISGDGASGSLGQTIGMFDKAMEQLLEGAENQGIMPPPDRQIAKQLKRTNKAWIRFKKLLVDFEESGEMPSGDRVQLANLSDQVLREMDLAVWMYSEH